MSADKIKLKKKGVSHREHRGRKVKIKSNYVSMIFSVFPVISVAKSPGSA
jgi:biotin carboxylase